MNQKENSKTAFIVKDSKSYVDVEEAWYRLTGKQKGSILFIVIPKGYSTPSRYVRKKEIIEVIDKDKWEEIIWIDTWSNNHTSEFKLKMRKNRLLKFIVDYREYLYNLLDRIRLDRLAKKYKPCPIVVSGHKNTHEHLAASLEPETLYLVDAGLSVLKRISNSGYIDYSSWFKKKFSRRMLFKMTGFRVFDRKKTTLFTAYADQINTRHSIEKNTQEYKKAIIKNTEIGNHVIWISSPIHEMVKEVKLQSYVNYMKASLALLDIDGSDVIYIPHARKENSEDIKFIQKAIGCRVDGRLLPVEMKVSGLKTLPKICISPLSSALVNLDVLSNGKIRMISAWHYEFNCFESWIKWQYDVKNNKRLSIEFLNVDRCDSFFGIKADSCADGPIYKNFQDWQVSGMKEKKKKQGKNSK